MDFEEGINVIYPDGQRKRDTDAANEYLKDIPISVEGGGALELEMSTVNSNCVSFDPRSSDARYAGLENIDSEKYFARLTVSNPELGRRPMLFVQEKGGDRRWVRMFLQPKEDNGG